MIDDESLDHHCYDALAPWSYSSRDSFSLVALLPSAEAIWIAFDSNPAVAANFVLGVRTVEAFLAEGAPAGTPKACADALRAHLIGLRTPGSTTRVELRVRVEGPSDHGLIDARLGVRGVSSNVPLPGPRYAGVQDWPVPGRRDATLRLLVPAGPSTLDLDLTLTNPSDASRYLLHSRASFEVCPRQGERVRLEHLVETRDWPTLRTS